MLHIDTSASNGVVALSASGQVVAAEPIADSRSQAAEINGLIDAVCSAAGITLRQLAGVAVCAGPGSYTGLRIGLATAKAICYIHEIPLFAHNKLALMAHQCLRGNPGYEEYTAVIPAREAEYFLAVYDKEMNERVAPVHITREDLAGERLNSEKNKCVVVSTMALAEDMDVLGGYMVNAEILDIAQWAMYAHQQYKCNGSVNLATAEPFYLKQVYTHNSKKNNDL